MGRWGTLGALLAAGGILASAVLAPAFAQPKKKEHKESSFFDLPPIRSNGSVGYTLVGNKTPTTSNLWQHQLNGNYIGNTYIWQPWFATVQGNLLLTRTSEAGGAPVGDSVTGGGSNADKGSSSLTTTGEFEMGILPFSKYPTSISYSRQDASVQSYDSISDRTQDRFSIFNQFQWDNTLRFNSRLGTDQSSTTSGSTTTGQNLSIQANKQFDTWVLDLGASHDQGSSSTKEGSQSTHTTELFTSRHNYSPIPSVRYDSTTTLMMQNAQDRTSTYSSMQMQAVSTAYWRSTDMPLYLSGAARTFSETTTQTFTSDSVGGDTDKKQQLLLTNGSASYNFNPQLVGNAGVGLNYRQVTAKASQGATATPTPSPIGYSGNGGISYGSLPAEVMGFAYSWNAGSTLGWAGGGDGSTYSYGARGGHSGSRPVEIPFLGPVRLALSQTLGADFAATSGMTNSLSNSGSLTYAEREGNQVTMIRFSVSDSRQFGGLAANYQLINTQVSKQIDSDRLTSWTADINIQSSRQQIATETTKETGKKGDSEWDHAVYGEAAYNRRNLLNIRNLRYRASVEFNAAALLPISTGTEDTSWQRRLINRVDYRIGQIDTGFQVRNTQTAQGLSHVMMFRVMRSF